MNKFSKKEALTAGWETFKAHWVFLLGVLLFSLFLNFLPSTVSDFLKEDYGVLAVIVTIIGWVFQTIVALGMIRIAIELIDNKPVQFANLFSDYRRFFGYILSSILTSLVVILGFVLLIIPGIYLAIRLQFVTYALLDQNLSAIDAIKKSWAMTRGSVINLFIFDLVLGLVTILGLLVLGVGIFIAIPVTMLAMAWAYRKLLV